LFIIIPSLVIAEHDAQRTDVGVVCADPSGLPPSTSFGQS
jgi:hypothetical protein